MHDEAKTGGSVDVSPGKIEFLTVLSHGGHWTASFLEPDDSSAIIMMPK